MKLSFVCPVYYEEDIVKETYKELKKAYSEIKLLDNKLNEVEYIFVNNHSKDNTCPIIRNLNKKDPNVKLIRFSRNFGYETAYSAGIQHATGDVLITLDGDLQDPPNICIEMYKKYLEGNKIVLGKRIRRKGVNPILKIYYKAFYKLINILSDTPMYQEVGEFRLIDKEIVQKLNNFNEREKYIRGIISWMGYDPGFVEYIREKRKKGKSSFSISKLFSLAFDSITSFTTAPLRLFTYLGLIFSGIGFALINIYTFVKILDPTVPRGFPTIIISILFFGGLNLIGLGIIGEYVGRIYKEVKKRPEYLIEYKVGFDK
ncbi:Prophage bactoprenol glucosyl transferase [subsurface metagenome]